MTGDPPPLETLADRVNWLISQARGPGEKEPSNGKLAREIAALTGHSVTPSAIYKLRDGQTVNPHWSVIDGLSRYYGVPAGWFSGSLDEPVADSVTADIALLAELRDMGVTGAHLNAMRKIDPGARRAIITMIEVAEQALQRSPEPAPGSRTRRPRRAQGEPGPEPSG